jgi:hypothetical protein
MRFWANVSGNPTLLKAATSCLPPARPAHKRKRVLMLSEAEMGPEHKGYLCAQLGALNLHSARRVAGNDKQGNAMPLHLAATLSE